MTLETVDLEKTYTLEEFWQLASRINSKRYELVQGKLVEMSPTGRKHGKIEIKLLLRLGEVVEKGNLGELHPSDTGFVLAPGTVRAPDIAFLTINRLTDLNEDGFIPIPPDLVVEVISPSDLLTEVEEKVEEYLQAGVQLIWVINPRRKVVYVYRAGSNQRETLREQDELSGEEVLPGFQLKIAALFE